MVSVILPNYNHALYLEKRIDSILNQTYQDFELIILDDCSTDNSRDIIEGYRNIPKISHIVYNKLNSGTTFKQWKKGIDLAKGKYIWIAESDDWADYTFLEKSLRLMNVYHSTLNVVQSSIVDKRDQFIRKKDQILGGDFLDKKCFLENYLLYNNSIYNASMVLFRKDAINEAIWSEVINYKYCGDWLFWSEIIMNGFGGVSEVKEYLNYFRTHDKNVSNKSERNGLAILEGFSISKKLFNQLELLNIASFFSKWLDIWATHKIQYRFQYNVNLKVFILFMKERPSLIFEIFKRLLKSSIK